MCTSLEGVNLTDVVSKIDKLVIDVESLKKRIQNVSQPKVEVKEGQIDLSGLASNIDLEDIRTQIDNIYKK